MYFVFPIPAKYFVAHHGRARVLLVDVGSGGGVANATHLGGLLVGICTSKGGAAAARGPK